MRKRFIRGYRINSVFTKIFIILVLSISLPMLVANIIIHNKSVSTIQSQAYDANIKMLYKTSQSVDLIFKDIKQILVQLARNENVVSLAVNPEQNYFTRNKDILNDLKDIAKTNEYVLSIYVYSKFANTVLSSNGSSYTLEGFYDKELLEDYEQSEDDAYQFVSRKAPDEFRNEFNCITLMENIPYLSQSKLGAVVINIDEDKLYNAVNEFESNNEGEIYAVNSEGQVVVDKDKSKLRQNISFYDYSRYVLKNNTGFFDYSVNGQKLHFTYVTSVYNGWKYVYSIPMDKLQSASDVTSRWIIAVTLICILLGLIISFRTSRGIYGPIEKLVNLVAASPKYSSSSDRSSIKDEYEFLDHAYNEVIDENKNMETILNDVKPMIKEKLFMNLILGKNSDLQEISEKLSLINVDIGMENFITIVMQIDAYGKFCKEFDEINRNLYKINLINSVEKIIKRYHKGVCIEAESDKIAAIINFNEDVALIQAQEESAAIASIVKNIVSKNYPFTITAGIGRMYKDIVNIKLSYEEALKALKYKLYQGKNEIINIDDIESQTEELYYYGSEKEKLLISSLRLGQQKEVETIVDEIYKEFMDSRNISHAYVSQIFVRITSSIAELVINMGMTIEKIFGTGCNLYEEISSKETIDDMKSWLMNICYTVLSAVEDINNTRTNKNAEKIIEYINKNLDRDISLNDIADWIGLSPAYVSRIFKENIGINYVDYLNRNRIQKAKQLLKDTKLPVKEVGFKVGFTNIRTFMRTFKKYEGIPPGQYRDNI